VLGVLGGGIWSLATPSSFVAEGEVQVTVNAPRDTSTDIEIAARTSRQLAVTYAVTATSSSVVGDVAPACPADAALPELRAFAVQGTSIVRVRAMGPQQECTAAFAAAVVEALASTIETMENSDEHAVTATVIDEPGAVVLDTRPPLAFYISVGALIGLSAGLFGAFWRRPAAPRAAPASE